MWLDEPLLDEEAARLTGSDSLVAASSDVKLRYFCCHGVLGNHWLRKMLRI